MEKEGSGVENVSSAQAVLVGALASGVNVPTWNTLKLVFLMLGVSLTLILALAFTSSDSALILHVGFLVLITLTLFVLLSRKLVLDFETYDFYYPLDCPLSLVHRSSSPRH